MLKKINTKVIIYLFCIIILLTGCVTPSISSLRNNLSDNSDAGIILDVPFVKQKKLHCGPAALAAVFNYWGNSCSQNKIAEKVFSADLKGTLNIDLEKYAKDSGFWAKGYIGDLETIKTRLKAGIPVIVMQKLHPFILNRYHYTVIVGFDEAQKVIVEHTGEKEFVIRSYNGFKRNWYAAGNWLLEIMPLEQVKDDMSVEDNVELGVLLEKKGQWDASLKHYYDALRESSDTPMALFNIGNVYLRLGQLDDAELAYRKAIELNKDFPDCYNNMACLFIRKKDYEKAHVFVDKAIALDLDKRFFYLDTKAQIYYAQSKFEDAAAAFYKAEAAKQGISQDIVNRFYAFWQEKFCLIGKPEIVSAQP
ncbi:MAG: PA2778 family cysteine peptidase [Candidatus Omnitrophota bacterium]